MGQPVGIVRSVAPGPRLACYELDRSLSGMGHEIYRSIDDASGKRPADVLARRLFETGAVARVSIYTNVVTVEMQPEASDFGLEMIVSNLFIHYGPGVLPSAV